MGLSDLLLAALSLSVPVQVQVQVQVYVYVGALCWNFLISFWGVPGSVPACTLSSTPRCFGEDGFCGIFLPPQKKKKRNNLLPTYPSGPSPRSALVFFSVP